MHQKSPNIPINPKVFKWLRESSGWTLEEVSNRLNVSLDRVCQWENGDNYPTFNQIKTLSKAYKRPVAAFLLPEPQEEKPLPQDFRRLPGRPKQLSKKTLLGIRKARNLQEISSELLENIEEILEPEIHKYELRLDPEIISTFEREKFEISIEDQFKWKNSYDAFNTLRKRIEAKNICVFQFPMEMDELRGFTLMDTYPYAIVINSSDIIQARLFTLLHEYAHILLHEPSLCTPESPLLGNSHGAIVEKWCNHFAASFLLPKEKMSEEFAKYGVENYSRISSRYKVSLTTVLTRLVSLNLITNSQYRNQVNILRKKADEKKEVAEKGGSGETLDKKARREKGDGFISLVVENSNRGFITYNDALGYLNVKTKNLGELSRSM